MGKFFNNSAIWFFIVISGCILTVLYCLLWWVQGLLLFVPYDGARNPDNNSYPFRNPGQFDLPYEEVYLKSKDGCQLHGWLIASGKRDQPTVIYFQGNAGNMGFRLEIFNKLFTLSETNVFAISYRGYGKSKGSPSERGLYLDAEAALDYLLDRNDIDEEKLFLFGSSLGGAVAIDLASKREFDLRGLIVENTFTNYRDVAMATIPPLEAISGLFSRVQRFQFDSITKIKSLKLPILFLSSQSDEIVPKSQMEKLYKSAKQSLSVELLKVSKALHNDIWIVGGTTCAKAIRSFIDQALKLPRPSQTTILAQN